MKGKIFLFTCKQQGCAHPKFDTKACDLTTLISRLFFFLKENYKYASHSLTLYLPFPIKMFMSQVPLLVLRWKVSHKGTERKM